MLRNISDSREQQLEELKSFTDVVNIEVASFISTLGWTMENLTKDVNKEYFECQYDSSHRLTEVSFDDHLASCQWKTEGYRKHDVPLSEPTLITDSSFCIKFDKQLQAQVLRMAKEQNPMMKTGMGERLVPRTSDRIVTDFTSDERRALYDYVIANTTKPNIGEDITNINNMEPQQKEDKQLSLLELLIQERNLKRRRAKHKGVHTNKRSHIEVLREVINQQMEVYVDYISGQKELSEESHHHSRERERRKSSSEHVTNVQSIKANNFNTEKDRTEHLNKIFHISSRDNYNSGERNNHCHQKKKDSKKRDRSEERSYYRSRDQDRQEKYSDEIDRKRRREYRTSHSKERKSHKKDKHQSKNFVALTILKKPMAILTYV
ncbi:U11/U12 small nuclear ribonucleoprotein 48 kDa protein isoform X2 [Monomorium pharaonis]|uniref:U11/U12 small nuclear ribonucleoprotein 48 kDa protein isoform X2 n=1 Tax=Monomorium pharaonis TaxID=307658 RepID=UPI00063EE010|nr:U11/U12 small nuclear ribonucleoprotein 48 kDa protein isoform X2 [Monomorium pharaonis]